MIFSHTDAGTSETRWAGVGIAALEPVDLALALPAGGRLVVAAAHPDDESLGAGGLIHMALRSGASVHVVLCSAGEASHPRSPTHSRESLARIRVDEFADALRNLAPGAEDKGPTWEFLGLPDGRLSARESEIESRLTAACRGATALAAPYRHDGHSDHDALGGLAARIASALDIDLLEFPIWYWHWADPRADDRWRAWHTLALDGGAVRSKAAALSCHTSQVAPLSDQLGDEALLSASFQRHFTRSRETYAWTPNVAGSALNASARFDALYRRSADPWDSLGSAYEAAKRSATLSALRSGRYGRALEIGCSIGTLSRALAAYCDRLVAVDASVVAVELARERLADLPNVQVHAAVLPRDWTHPPSSLDLVVLSEVGYFLARSEFIELLGQVSRSLRPGGELLLCHWLHPVRGWPMDGKTVHGLVHRVLGWTAVSSRREADYLLEVFIAPETGHG